MVNYEKHFDDAMIVIGFGKAHVLLLVCCGLLLMFTTNETMGMAIIAPASQCDLQTDELRKASIEAAGFVGMIMAGYFWGYYSDEVGRRVTLLYSTITALIFSFCSMLVTNYWAFFILRFLTGLCVAGPGFTALTYFGEFCSSKNRALIVNYMCMFNGFSMMYCPGLAEIFKHMKFQIPIIGNLVFKWWRLLGLLLAVPGLISVFLLLLMPESPRFLLVMNRREEAFRVLDWLCRLNKGKELKDFNIEIIRLERGKEKNLHHNIFQTMAQEIEPLFHPPYAKDFALCCVIMFGLMMVSNGLGIWFSDIRNRVEMHSDRINNGTRETMTLCNILTDFNKQILDFEPTYAGCIEQFYTFRDSIILGFSFIFEYNIFGLVLFFMPRKILFVSTLILSGSCGIALPFFHHHLMVRIGFVVFLSIPSVIINLLGSTLIGFVPTYLRGKAICTCMICGLLGAVLGTTIMSHMLEGVCIPALVLFGSLPLVCALLGFLLPFDDADY